jgi:anti-sigma B factor antagonist
MNVGRVNEWHGQSAVERVAKRRRGLTAQKDDIPTADVHEFEVKTERASNGTVVVGVTGELDLSTHEQLRDPLVAAAEDENSVVVDLSACEFIDSSGIRALLVGHEALAGNGSGGRMVVAGPQPQVMRVLEMTGLGEAIPVHESVEQALQSLGG